MTTRELAAATRKFDREFVVDESRPLSSEEKQEWRRMRRNRGRPKVGQGYQRVSISMERGLLQKATALAKKRGISRSRLVAEALADALTQGK